MLTRNKVKLCGQVLTHYQFQNSVMYGDGYKPDKKPDKHLTAKKPLANYYRAKNNIKDLINTNYNHDYYKPHTTKFVTLTFKENLSLNEAITYRNKFIKRLNYNVLQGKSHVLKYISIYEYQKRGALHYHDIFFNLPYITKSKLERIWGKGFCQVVKVYHSAGMADYVTKYLTKDFVEHKYFGRKSYYVSHDLIKPVYTFNEKAISEIVSLLGGQELVYQPKEYDIPFGGSVREISYFLKSRTLITDIKNKLLTADFV
jgi:hypothetical protein